MADNMTQKPIYEYESTETNMDEHLKQAIEIVKAQASVRAMTEDEIATMVAKVAAGIRALDDTAAAPAVDAEAFNLGLGKDTIKEKSITCLECGKPFKILTKKHLAHHGLTPAEYREKYGLKKGQPLVCKSLARERRKKMNSLKIWERNAKAVA